MEKLLNRLRLMLQVLRTGRVQNWGVRVVPPITMEEVAEAKQFFPMEKYFIFGHARSGTTLLVRLIRLHPEIHCNYQAHFFTKSPLLKDILADEKFERYFSRPSNRWNRGKDMSPVVLRAVVDFILERDARLEGKTIVGDKSPNVIMNGKAVREMHTVYPDARLIYIVRDGRDTLISHLFQNLIDAPDKLSASQLQLRDAFIRDPEPFMNGEKSIFTEDNFRRMASGWVKNVQETDSLGRKLYQDRYHVLRYEDMLKEPYETMQQVWAFLGATQMDLADAVSAEMIQNPDAAYQKKVASDLVKNLEKGKRGSWQELFTARDKQIFKEIAGETLIAWGYEKDREW